jgi:hypothetical protein
MMKRILMGCALGFFAAGAANATLYTQIYTGTVRSGTDTANLFGGGSLAGQAFTATYVFDDTLGLATNNGVEHSAHGGSTYPALATPNLSTSLTINGLTYSFVGTFYGEIYASYEAAFSYLSSNAQSGTATLTNTVYDGFGAAYPDPAFAFSGSVAGALGNSGQFSLGDQILRLTNSTYAVSAAAAVPEPASWAMFIGGFGLVGGAMRRRARIHVRFA